MWLTSFFRAPLAARTSHDGPVHLYNTLSASKEEFTLPPQATSVRMYHCGPTVYGRQHIGNLSMYVFTDILRRTVEHAGFRVKQVINITDIGHLTSDADEGEDKMSKGLKAEGMKVTLENMRLLADKYTGLFFDDLRTLNIDTETILFPRASDYIDTQILLVKTLEEKGYAYRGSAGVYFDTASFSSYGKLGAIDLDSLREGARVAKDDDKRNPTDFLLWKLDKKIGWESPWGKGFPGWHIECSAMIRKTLGERIDIHTGGIEHIPIHHNNEIAQSESVTGKSPLSRFWMHRAHIRIDGGKIAKSEGTVVYLSDILERGYHPLALRYLFLTAHYRTPMNFSWQSLEAAQNAYRRLLSIRLASSTPTIAPEGPRHRFFERINDDLDTPGALAVLWDSIKSCSSDEAAALIIEADSVLNLRLAEPRDTERTLARGENKEYVPADAYSAEISDILARREEARAERKWEESDTLRDELSVFGYGVDDTPAGQRIYKQ